MKRLLRVSALCLALCMAALLSAAAFADGAPSAVGAPSMVGGENTASPVGLAVDVMVPTGVTPGPNSEHGGNQSRIVTVSSGTYLGLLTDKTASGEYGEMSLIQVRPDGSERVLQQGVVYGANRNGGTVTVMADNRERVWAYTGWEKDNGEIEMTLWKYDPETDTVQTFVSTEIIPRGNSYGYSVASVNAADNKIYATMGGGGKPGWFLWNCFDMETETWSKPLAVKTSARFLYHYGFSDGKGGLFLVVQRAPENEATTCDLGIRVSKAIKEYHSRKEDVSYTWDELSILHIPDPTVAAYEEIPIETAVYDVLNGIYPNVNHAFGDCLVDSQGLLHVLYYSDDNGTAGRVERIKTYDVADNFCEVASGELTFLYGFDHTYEHRFYEDLTGRLYILAAPRVVDSQIEIWQATDEAGVTYRLVDDHVFTEEPAAASDSNWDPRIVIANARNNSVPSDIATVLMRSGGTWNVFHVDFAALRAKLGQ